MVRTVSRFLSSCLLAVFVTIAGCNSDEKTVYEQELTPEEKERLAVCLTENGWVMYGTSTCSGCRAQRKVFGEAFAHIKYVECDPYETNAEAERCLKCDIRKTPTWIQEVDGKEVQRLEMFQLLEYLVEASGCR